MRRVGLSLVLVLGGCNMGHLGNSVIWPVSHPQCAPK